MSKRFTETSKWTNNKWFRSLPPLYKLFWMYICDLCDNCGMWHEDMEQAEFHMGTAIDKDEALRLFNGRVKILMNKKGDETKWFIVEFCDFQYGELDENTANKARQSYVQLLKKHGVWKGHTRGIHAPQEKDKEKEKEKDKEKDKEKEYAPRVKMPEEDYNDLCVRFGKHEIDTIIENMSDWILSKKKGVCPYSNVAAAIKTWLRKKHGVESVSELEVKHKVDDYEIPHHRGEDSVRLRQN